MPVWICAAVAKAIAANGLMPNASDLLRTQTPYTGFPNLQIAVDGTNLCGAFPPDTSVTEIPGYRGPTPTLPKCTGPA